MPDAIGRRELIKLGASAADRARGPIAAQANHLFHCRGIRAGRRTGGDDHSGGREIGGARAAKVVDFMDATLAEAFEPREPEKWHAGLQLVDALCQKMHDHTFMEASPKQRTAVLSRVAENQTHPESFPSSFLR